jgi:hypothetical protein
VPLNVDGTISSAIRSINGHLHSNRVIASSGLLSSPWDKWVRIYGCL